MKFDRDPYLERVYLTGQVSNFRRRPSHQYFSLRMRSCYPSNNLGRSLQKLGLTSKKG
ncbi:MAG: hypothetical protein ACLTZN_00760 [Streptococcus sp.]